MRDNELTQHIIGLAIEIHKELGPGLLENVYKECLCHLLTKSGNSIQKEKPIPVYYDGVKWDCGYRVDIVVNNRIAIEVKSVEALHEVHAKQVLTYIKLADYPLGLLINFNVLYLKEGVKRIINGYNIQ